MGNGDVKYLWERQALQSAAGFLSYETRKIPQKMVTFSILSYSLFFNPHPNPPLKKNPTIYVEEETYWD